MDRRVVVVLSSLMVLALLTVGIAGRRLPPLRLAMPPPGPIVIRIPIPENAIVEPPAPVTSVRVAAVQCYSTPGKIAANRKRLTALIHKAAAGGAKIVVLPECAVQGYMNPDTGMHWDHHPEDDSINMHVADAAELVPGATTKYFCGVAAAEKIYLTVPLIEAAERKFFNSVVLIDPGGRIIAQHRKRSLWMEGDSLWASEGDGKAAVADTPYGRLGLMICHDLHVMPPVLKKAGVSIVLYSVGWYGPNTKEWFGDIFPMKYVAPHGFSVIAANWSKDDNSGEWAGQGFSAIYAPSGEVLKIAEGDGEEIIFADVPCVTVKTEPAEE